CDPTHDRHGADGVLGAAFDHPVAVGHVHEHVALAVVEAHDVQALEHQATALIEHALAILQLAENLYGAHLAAGDARIAGVLRQSQLPFDSTRHRAADVTRDALHLGVVKAVDCDPIVGPEPAEAGTD